MRTSAQVGLVVGLVAAIAAGIWWFVWGGKLVPPPPFTKGSFTKQLEGAEVSTVTVYLWNDTATVPPMEKRGDPSQWSSSHPASHIHPMKFASGNRWDLQIDDFCADPPTQKGRCDIETVAVVVDFDISGQPRRLVNFVPDAKSGFPDAFGIGSVDATLGGSAATPVLRARVSWGDSGTSTPDHQHPAMDTDNSNP